MAKDIEIIDNTKEVERATMEAVEMALEMMGTHIEGEAKHLIEADPRHIDTGRLRNSITHQVDMEEPCVYIGTNVEYAIYVHEGTGKYNDKGQGRSEPWPVFLESKGKWIQTRGIKPNRFLRKAVELNEDQLPKALDDALRKKGLK